MMSGTASGRTRGVMLGLMLIGFTVGPATAANEPQVRFEVARPFRVGSHGFDSGVISVHSISAYTPSTSILEVWVNGECLGLMTAHRSESEEAPIRTEAVFRQDDDGRLEMIGFQVTGRPAGTTYRFP